MNYLLPVLLSKINEDQSDLKYQCLKIMTDILIHLLDDHGLKQQETQQKLELVVQNLIPLSSQLLSQPEPASFYGQRLLSALLDSNPKLTKHLPQQTIHSICDNYHQDEAKLNKHTIKILRHLMTAFSFETIH